MLTPTISPTLGHEEQKLTLLTQAGSGRGNGGNILVAPSIPNSDDNEPRAAVLEAEAHLLRQRINSLLNVTDRCNEMSFHSLLREQRASAIPDFDILDEGGAKWEI